jgi:hypothetical protein
LISAALRFHPGAQASAICTTTLENLMTAQEHLTNAALATKRHSMLLLTPAQAEAVYSAMCALNNIGSTLQTTVRGVCVRVSDSGEVHVWEPFTSKTYELYATQHEFATTYGLATGA